MKITGERPLPEPASPPSAESPRSAAPSSAHGPSFSRVLKGLARAVDGGDALVASAYRGNLGGLDSAQLIALQAGIYRYTEAVDLLAKLVDRTATAAKTVVSPH